MPRWYTARPGRSASWPTAAPCRRNNAIASASGSLQERAAHGIDFGVIWQQADDTGLTAEECARQRGLRELLVVQADPRRGDIQRVELGAAEAKGRHAGHWQPDDT